MKITAYSVSEFEKPFLKAVEDEYSLSFKKEKLTKETVSLAQGSEAVVIFASDKVTGEVLKALKDIGVKYVSARTMGVDYIDLDKAKELGIKVANVPHYSPHAIAEHAIALMLALNRKLIVANRKLREHDFRLEGLVGFDMYGKTVGIIGAGDIGATVAKILYGFGCKLLIHDMQENQQLKDQYDVKYVEMDELCRESDIISIHAPLKEDTKYLIEKEKIDSMKKGVMIINVARGAICNTKDLIEGLKSNQIGCLGMDVYEYEEGLFFEDHSEEVLQDDLFVRLMGFKNVVITAHQAFLTEEALRGMAKGTIDNLNAWKKGEKSENEVV